MWANVLLFEKKPRPERPLTKEYPSIMIVTCPYCHKKMCVSLSQLLFRGRLSVACPECKCQVYGFETTTGDPQDRHQRH